jgi:hypothetical protein
MDKALENYGDEIRDMHPVVKASDHLIGKHSIYVYSDENPEQTRRQNKQTNGIKVWYKWGDDDRLPNRFFDKSYENDLLPIIIERKASLISGIDVAIYKDIKEGTQTTKDYQLLSSYPEIEDFFLDNDIDLYLNDRAKNLQTFYNAFTTFYKGRAVLANKIVKLRNESVQKFRCGFYEEYKSPTGETINMVKTYYKSGDFKMAAFNIKKQGGNINPDSLLISDVIPYASADLHPDSLKNEESFVKHTKIYQSGQDYYSFPEHYFAIKAWLGLSKKIPIYQESNIDNSITPKSLVIIPAKIVEARASAKNTKDYLKIQKEIADEIETQLSGAKNAGKTISSISYTVGDGKTEHIQILPIVNNNNDSLFLQSYDVSTRAISRSSGLSPILAGIHLDGSQGSGSEIKYLYNYEVQVAAAKRKLLLADIRYVAKFNGWPKDLKFEIVNAKMIDTAQDKTGVSNTLNQTSKPQGNAV